MKTVIDIVTVALVHTWVERERERERVLILIS